MVAGTFQRLSMLSSKQSALIVSAQIGFCRIYYQYSNVYHSHPDAIERKSELVTGSVVTINGDKEITERIKIENSGRRYTCVESLFFGPCFTQQYVLARFLEWPQRFPEPKT
mgnify:FL=1